MSSLNVLGVAYDQLKTAERDALTLPEYGLVVFNTDVNSLQINLGTPAVPEWSNVGGGTDTNTWNMTGVAFVDPVNGNDGTAVVGDGNLPFQTLAQAQAVSDKIICLPGTYTGVNILENNKHIHFMPGCVSIGSNFTDAGTTANVKITGYLKFDINSRGFLIFGANSVWDIEIDEMDKTRKIVHASNGSIVNLIANRIVTKNSTVSGYACRMVNGGKITLRVREYLKCYHWLAGTGTETAGGIYGDNTLTVFCPYLEVTAVSHYGNQFKALINHQSYSKCIYNINVDKFKNNSITQTTAFGILESGLVLYTGGAGSQNNEFHFTGDYDTGVMYGWLDYSGVYQGITTFTNGSLKSDTNPFSSIAIGVGPIVIREIFAKNWRFEGGRTGNGFMQLGNGRYVYMVDCQFSNLNATGIRIWNKIDLIPGAGVPELKLYNCIAELANNGGGNFITLTGALTFSSVNTYSNETLGAVADAWGGYSQIVNFTIPKF
jgi:hypothetical protein